MDPTAARNVWLLLLALVCCSGCMAIGLDFDAPSSEPPIRSREYVLPRTSSDMAGATTPPTDAEPLIYEHAASSVPLKVRAVPDPAVKNVLTDPLDALGTAEHPPEQSVDASPARPLTVEELAQQFARSSISDPSRRAEVAGLVEVFLLLQSERPDAALARLDTLHWTGDDFLYNAVRGAVLRELGETGQSVRLLERQLIRLRNQSELDIASLVLASKVRGLGDYDQFEKYEFAMEQPVIVYFEPKNFICKKAKAGSHLTSLDIVITLYDRDQTQRKRWQLTMEHKTMTYLYDMYVCTQDLRLPRLEPGKYTMKVSVTDRGAADSESADAELSFRINA